MQSDSRNHPPTSDALLLACILPPPSFHPSSQPALPPFFLPYLMGAHTDRVEIDWSSPWTREEEGAREEEVGWRKTERKSELP